MITRNRILFLIGIWTLLTPFLGFPSSFKNFSVSACGVFVILLAFMYARDKRMNSGGYVPEQHSSHRTDEISTESYMQNGTMPREQSNERYTDIEEIRNRSKTVGQ